MPKLTLVLCALALAASCVWAQENSTLPPTANNQQASSTDSNKTERHKRPGAARDIGSGAGNIGTGAAKGAGDAAKGVGKGAVDLVTLHPVDAAAAVGKGAAYTGKDVAVGTAKGTGKIARGVGKAIKKIF